MRLDHLSYAAPTDHLADVVQRLGSRLGAGFSDGGVHPRFGTRNFVLPLAGGSYLEVVSALDHPAAERAPFGQAVKNRCTHGGGWLGWVVAVTDLAAVEQRLGRSAVEGHRRRPDGFDLKWRQIGVTDLMDDPQLPFFIHWDSDSSQHPANHARSDLRIVKLEIAGEAHTVNDWLGQSNGHPLDDVDVEWVEPADGEIGLVAAHFATPNGIVRVD
ncbi:MAG TPA: VOC family protein [Actinomycetes bacterium]|nr:VOC family protein [Actinomycetes bacterium]